VKRALALALVLAAGGFAAAHARGASKTAPLLGGWVQVVAYSDSDVRICPDYAIAVAPRAGGPPSFCSTGLPAAGVQTDALPYHSTNPDESWGFLYLTGTYDSGTFTVSSQSATNQSGPEPPLLVTPPCPRPRHGWRLVLPTDKQWHALERYQRHHRHDIVGVEMFDGGSNVGAVLTVASTHPRRARKTLRRAWPRQLCVVRSRYSMSQFRHAQKETVNLLMADDEATYGWVSGAGGSTATNDGQPATSLDLLVETPAVSDVLDTLPQGIVAVDASLHPVAAS
jgi:hypothetical protein